MFLFKFILFVRNDANKNFLDTFLVLVHVQLHFDLTVKEPVMLVNAQNVDYFVVNALEVRTYLCPKSYLTLTSLN